MPKFYLTCSPRAVPPVSAPPGFRIATIGTDPDGAEGSQGAVLRAGYAGSPDPNPAGPGADDGDDAVQFWRGDWGVPLPAATFGAFDASGRMVGLSYVCERSDGPLLADLVVMPAVKGRGVGAALIAASAAGLIGSGHDVFNLAVHPDNVGPLVLYARMGFRLVAGDCRDGEEVAYRTEDHFRAANRQFEDVMPELSVPVNYCVVPSPVPASFVQFVNTDSGHRLPGRILAALVRHRRGSGAYELDPRGLAAAIGLLSPAAVATIYQHPNLGSWRRALDTGANRFVVAFGADALEYLGGGSGSAR